MGLNHMQEIDLPRGTAWAVYEHSLGTTVLFVGVCQMRDIYNPRDARNNSEWVKQAVFDRMATRVVSTHETEPEAQRAATEWLAGMDKPPHCNEHGYPLNSRARPVMCSNGQRYASQSEAARLLDLQQSSISMALGNGGRKTAGGLRFWYADEVAQ